MTTAVVMSCHFVCNDSVVCNSQGCGVGVGGDCTERWIFADKMKKKHINLFTPFLFTWSV